MNALLFLVFGLLLCLPAWAQETDVAPTPIPDIPYQKFVLDNGLTLIVHEDRKAPIVAVNVWYHVGSKNEPEGRSGFAHLFEHLMFNGSENADDDYFQVLERLGATDLNGTTNEDRTNYFQNVPTNALDVALWMESDRMGHLLGAITQEKLDEQRGVVQNEKRQGENEPYGRVYDLMLPSIYPANHPYSWETIGSMDDLNAATLEDVWQFFARRLRNGSDLDLLCFSVIDESGDFIRIKFLYPYEHEGEFAEPIVSMAEHANHLVHAYQRKDTTFTSHVQTLGTELQAMLAREDDTMNIFSVPLIEIREAA